MSSLPSSPPNPREESRGRQGLKILLVEDDADQAAIADLLLENLYGNGYVLDRAANAAEARQELQRKRHDVVLLDYRLGDGTGLELLQEVRAAGINTPVIVLTGQNDRDIDLAAMQQGASDYLVKGEYTGQLLDRAIRYAIERERSRVSLNRARDELEQRVIARTAELVRARKEAERASRAKSEFLSRMSHELRTPMNAIVGFAQLLELDGLSEAQRDSLAHITKASGHLLFLINEMLDISGAEAEREDLTEVLVNISDVLGTAVTAHEDLAAQHQVTISHESQDADGVLILADPRCLNHVLGHLLTNAIKFNHAGGGVAVTHEVTDAGPVRITVRDSGGGIAQEDLAKLFVPFERLHAEEHGIEGAGLGLALSKRLVEAMGGSLSVESTPGSGTAFSIEMPAASAGSAERIYLKMNQ